MPKLFDLGAHIEIISNQQHMELGKSYLCKSALYQVPSGN